MRAWMIQWRDSDVKNPAKNQPVTFLSPRLGPGTVRRIVEALYGTRWYTLKERASAARQGGHVPYPAEISNGTVTCGHNPFLYARKVKDIEFTVDPDTQEEILRWVEWPLYKPGPNLLPVQARGDLPQSIVITSE